VLSCEHTTAVSADLVAQLYVAEPIITVAGGTTLASSATVYIKAAADEATNNYALWVDSGATRFDGAVQAADGAVGTPSYTFTDDLNTGMWSPAADTIAVSTDGAERFRVDASGNVGLGKTPAYGKLDIAQTGTGAQDRGLSVDVSPSSSSGDGPNNAVLFSAGNADMDKTMVRIHHEAPVADQTLLSIDVTGSNTEIFSIDEDGDGYHAGNLGIGTTAAGTAVAATKLVHSINCVRAWGVVTQTSGSATLNAGFNCTVARGDIGDTDVTLTPWAGHSNDYCVVVTIIGNTHSQTAYAYNHGTGGFKIICYNGTSLADLKYSFTVIGD